MAKRTAQNPAAEEPKEAHTEQAILVQEERTPLTPAPAGNSSVESLISQAIQAGTPVDTLERLLAMRDRVNAEIAKKAFDADMAKFQMACPIIKKTKKVYTNDKKLAYSYAPLESIVEQVKEVLAEHGFSYATKTQTLDGKVIATVIVKHVGGHQEESSMEVPLGNKTQVMSNTQVVAAATTFAKRYAFCNAFGILTGDEDTDASPASVGETAPATPPSAVERQQARSTGQQAPSPQAGAAPIVKDKVFTVKKILDKGNRHSVLVEMDGNEVWMTAFRNVAPDLDEGSTYLGVVEKTYYNSAPSFLIVRLLEVKEEAGDGRQWTDEDQQQLDEIAKDVFNQPGGSNDAA